MKTRPKGKETENSFSDNALADQLMPVARKVSGTNNLLNIKLQNFIPERYDVIHCLHCSVRSCK